ncbi:MAG: hypothetical protein WBF58_05090 [Xanthobacteraceae bacterium]
MKGRCDHCRRTLGLLVHRYWHMRFCSAACMHTYQHRLRAETRAKILRLDHAAHEQSGRGGRIAA